MARHSLAVRYANQKDPLLFFQHVRHLCWSNRFLLSHPVPRNQIPNEVIITLGTKFRIRFMKKLTRSTLGRSLNSCKHAFDGMIRPPPPLHHTQAQGHLPHPGTYVPTSVPLLAPASNTGPVVASPSPESSAIPAKRPYFSSEKSSYTPRAIQPRPSSLRSTPMNVESGPHMSPLWGELNPIGDPPRKRGRPSKVESERRKAMAEARGEEWPPSRRSSTTKPKNPPTPSAGPGALSEGSVESPQATNIPTPETRRQESGSGPVTGGRGSAATADDIRRASESSNAGEMDSVLGIVRSQPGGERRISSGSQTGPGAGPRPFPSASPASSSDSFFPASRFSGPPLLSPSAPGTGRSDPRIFSQSPVASTMEERISQPTAKSELPAPSGTQPRESHT